MADGDVRFSIEEARRIRDEMRKLSDELNEERRTSLKTIPEGEHYALLLDAVVLAHDVGQAPTTTDGNAAGYALASLARWATNVQAFLILVKAGLWTEAYGVARIGSELAINLVWVAEGGPRKHFPDADSRATAMIHDARYSARTWFDEMHAAGAHTARPGCQALGRGSGIGEEGSALAEVQGSRRLHRDHEGVVHVRVSR